MPVYRITLNNNGRISHQREVAPAEVLSMLCWQVTLQAGYTLRSFFKMLDKYPILVKLSDFFPQFQEQYRACDESNCICDSLDALEFFKTVEMIGVPEKRIEIYNSLSGISREHRAEIKFMQLASLLDLPFRLGCLRHVVFGDQVDIFEFNTVFTLFELIDGIAWQLSFHGAPEQCGLGR
jgi:hypothetical protein